MLGSDLNLDSAVRRNYVLIQRKALLVCQRDKSEIYLPTFLFPGWGEDCYER
jgi:hypothetical protein